MSTGLLDCNVVCQAAELPAVSNATQENCASWGTSLRSLDI